MSGRSNGRDDRNASNPLHHWPLDATGSPFRPVDGGARGSGVDDDVHVAKAAKGRRGRVASEGTETSGRRKGNGPPENRRRQRLVACGPEEQVRKVQSFFTLSTLSTLSTFLKLCFRGRFGDPYPCRDSIRHHGFTRSTRVESKSETDHAACSRPLRDLPTDRRGRSPRCSPHKERVCWVLAPHSRALTARTGGASPDARRQCCAATSACDAQIETESFPAAMMRVRGHGESSPSRRRARQWRFPISIFQCPCPEARPSPVGCPRCSVARAYCFRAARRPDAQSDLVMPRPSGVPRATPRPAHANGVSEHREKNTAAFSSGIERQHFAVRGQQTEPHHGLGWHSQHSQRVRLIDMGVPFDSPNRRPSWLLSLHAAPPTVCIADVACAASLAI